MPSLGFGVHPNCKCSTSKWMNQFRGSLQRRLSGPFVHPRAHHVRLLVPSRRGLQLQAVHEHVLGCVKLSLCPGDARPQSTRVFLVSWSWLQHILQRRDLIRNKHL